MAIWSVRASENLSHFEQQQGSTSCRNTISNLTSTLHRLLPSDDSDGGPSCRESCHRELGIQGRTQKTKTYTSGQIKTKNPDAKRESCRALPCACLCVRTVSVLCTCLFSSCVVLIWLGFWMEDTAAILVLGLEVGLLETLDKSCSKRRNTSYSMSP